MIERSISKMNSQRRGDMSRSSGCSNGCRGRAGNVKEDKGCNGGGDCKALMKKLQMIDFAIVDTVLYLDSYPECSKALAYYNKLMCEREGIRKTLATKCMRPMSSFENAGESSWDWISSPWPWEASAN